MSAQPCKHWLQIEVGQAMQVTASFDTPCPLCRAEAAESALAAMTKRAEEAERNAERYLWLRERSRSGGTITYGPRDARKTKYSFGTFEPFSSEHSDLDAAIDAARGKRG